jgi:integrase
MSLQRIRAADEGVEMAQVTRASVSDIDVLATSWRLHLAAERKSAATITAYSYATTQLATFLREAGHAHQRRRDHTRAHRDVPRPRDRDSLSVDRRDPLPRPPGRLRLARGSGRDRRVADGADWPPKVSEQPVDVPTLDDVRKLLAACAGNDSESRRDTAIIRLFADARIRLAELTGVKLDDLDLAGGAVLVRGKGDRYRMASFGRKTAKARLPSRPFDPRGSRRCGCGLGYGSVVDCYFARSHFRLLRRDVHLRGPDRKGGSKGGAVKETIAAWTDVPEEYRGT